MATTTSSDDEELTRRDRREQYERVCSIIDGETSAKQPPMAALSSVKTTAGYIDIAPKHVEKRIKVGLKRGDLLREGDRVCLADADEVRKRIENADDVGHLRTLLEAEVSGPCRKPLIGEINERIDEVRDDE